MAAEDGSDREPVTGQASEALAAESAGAPAGAGVAAEASAVEEALGASVAAAPAAVAPAQVGKGRSCWLLATSSSYWLLARRADDLGCCGAGERGVARQPDES